MSLSKISINENKENLAYSINTWMSFFLEGGGGWGGKCSQFCDEHNQKIFKWKRQSHTSGKQRTNIPELMSGS